MTPPAGDETLIAAAQQGDQKALDALLRRHHDRIYSVCRRIAGNEPDALDATQEALMAVVRGIPKFDGRSAFGTWVYRVATNASLDELRRRKRRPDPGLPEHEREDESVHGVSGGGNRLDADVAERLDIDAALQQLPDDFRAPIVLRDLCGLDYAEIAETLDIAPGTVRSRIARGRRKLAEIMGNQTPSSERPSETT